MFTGHPARALPVVARREIEAVVRLFS